MRPVPVRLLECHHNLVGVGLVGVGIVTTAVSRPLLFHKDAFLDGCRWLLFVEFLALHEDAVKMFESWSRAIYASTHRISPTKVDSAEVHFTNLHRGRQI